MNAADHHRLRTWDNDHVWHPFTAMEAYREEGAPIIESGDGFEVIDIEGNRYWTGPPRCGATCMVIACPKSMPRSRSARADRALDAAGALVDALD